MDDQVDGRTLIGSYVCAERPGEFRWQPGSLTQVCFPLSNHYIFMYCKEYVLQTEIIHQQAVLHGYWVVFEDIDKAPSDVHSILLPLLEGATSFVTGHGEVIDSLFMVVSIV